MNLKKIKDASPVDREKMLDRSLFMRALPDVKKAFEIAKNSTDGTLEVVGTDVIIYYEDTLQESNAKRLLKKGMAFSKTPWGEDGYPWGDIVVHLDPEFNHLKPSQDEWDSIKSQVLEGKTVKFPSYWLYEFRERLAEEIQKETEFFVSILNGEIKIESFKPFKWD